MPAARAARALTPTATKRRPIADQRTPISTSTTAASVKSASCGMPNSRPTAKLLSAEGTDSVEVPLVTYNTVPYSNALTASVATSGVTKNRVIASPQINPETTPDARAPPIHRARAELSPAGNFVTKNAAKEMTQGTLRTRPPCWTTSVWPTAAVARIEAKQRTVSMAPADTLPGATTRLTT